MNIFYSREFDTIFEFPRLKNLEMAAFYKINHESILDLFEVNRIDLIDNSVTGVHWYNGSEIAKKFNNQYSELKDIDCTINEVLKRII